MSEKISEAIPRNEREIMVERILRKWEPELRCHLLRELTDGHTGATVLLVDIKVDDLTSEKKAGIQQIESGTLVLKIDEKWNIEGSQQSEPKRHETAFQRNVAFSRRHIPELIFSNEEDGVVCLYKIAGGRYARLARTELLPIDQICPSICRFSFELLKEFNKDYIVEHGKTVSETLLVWLKYRLSPDENRPLFELASQLTQGRRTFVQSKHIVPNPLALLSESIANAELPAVFSGMLHGDLHEGNVFWNKEPKSEDYWLIDFAYAREEPLLFDHFYFEISLLLGYYKQLHVGRLFGLLLALEPDKRGMGGGFVAQSDEGIRKTLMSFREGLSQWRARQEKNREDAFKIQCLLARVACGLNWASKRALDDNSKILAFAYAAHAAKEFLCENYPDTWDEWCKDLEDEGIQDRGKSSNQNSEEWSKLFQFLGGFDRQSKYVLISERQDDCEELSGVGLVPWSIVYDLDWESDKNGLLSRARSEIEVSRSFHIVGADSRTVNLVDATAWCMVAGWKTGKQPVPEGTVQWRRIYRKRVQEQAESLQHQHSGLRTYVVVLVAENSGQSEITRRIIEEIVDASNGEVVLCAIGLSGEVNGNDYQEVDRSFDMSVQDFGSILTQVYGRVGENGAPTVPGKPASVEVDLKDLRNFEEDFEVLHSNILDAEKASDSDGFWRGSPPTWNDLETETPISRQCDEIIFKAVTRQLHANESKAIELFHTPGAGGSTAALKAAWMVKGTFPTAILKRNSRYTADRICWLFHLTGMPVFVVADREILNRTEVKELLKLVEKENAKVVILHVVRVSKKVECELGVFDPMEKEESLKFAREFARRTNDDSRYDALVSVGNAISSDLVPLQSPFFFGLLTYENEFSGIDSYVRYHLENVAYREKKIIHYFSLICAFSQATLSFGLVRRMLCAGELDAEPVGEDGGGPIGWLDPRPRRLLVEWDHKVKMIHPFVAREVMVQEGGGEDKWVIGLADVSVDFIRFLLSVSGSLTQEVNTLFRNLFIDRDEWGVDDDIAKREQFSPLIELIPGDGGKGRVFELLTSLCPEEPHFWNHLGRYHVYASSPNFVEGEFCLKRAIEVSGGKDPLHHHGLGLVRRFWIRNKIRNIVSSGSNGESKTDAERVLGEIDHLFDLAMENFGKARKLAPENEYGYVTAIQLILYVAEELLKRSGREIKIANASDDSVGRWIRRNIPYAENLLAAMKRVRARVNGSVSSYEIMCITKLSQLYGDFSLVKTWEAMLENSTEPLYLRRAISTLYLVRRQRQWHKVEPKELRRIVTLSEENLRSDPTSQFDLRMWFQAFRRLPEFNYFEALERLEAWASDGSSVDAHFYLYILHFLRWTESESIESEIVVNEHIEKTVALRIGQRGYSREWLGNSPSWCPLVSGDDLGVWDRKTNFFSDTSKLAYFSGTIEWIKPQAGSIRIGSKLSAFFKPSPILRESSHLDAEVHFFLGFSYDGLRAWEVSVGPIPERRDDALAQRERKSRKEVVKVWIGGIPLNYNEFEIRGLFEVFGKVEYVDLPMVGKSKNNKGFAVVTLSSREDGEKAIATLNNVVLTPGRTLRLKVFQER